MHEVSCFKNIIYNRKKCLENWRVSLHLHINGVGQILEQSVNSTGGIREYI